MKAKKKPVIAQSDADALAECNRVLTRLERQLTILEDIYGLERGDQLERIEHWRDRLAARGKGAANRD